MFTRRHFLAANVAATLLPGIARSQTPGITATEIKIGQTLGIYAAASTHEATTPPPPTWQFFQLYRGGLDGRLGGRFERIALFLEGGAGIAMISSNVLEAVKITDPGERFSITFHGGAGIEYQLENRHYAVGLGVDAFLIPQFANMKAIDSRLYLRYTYGGG